MPTVKFADPTTDVQSKLVDYPRVASTYRHDTIFFAKRNYQLKKSQNERRPSIKLLLNPGFADLSDNDIGCHFLLSLNLC